MIKVFEITEERVFKTLVEIDVPDDIQWQTSDYDIAVDEAVALHAEWYEVGTHRKWRGSDVESVNLDRRRQV